METRDNLLNHLEVEKFPTDPGDDNSGKVRFSRVEITCDEQRLTDVYADLCKEEGVVRTELSKISKSTSRTSVVNDKENRDSLNSPSSHSTPIGKLPPRRRLRTPLKIVKIDPAEEISMEYSFNAQDLEESQQLVQNLEEEPSQEREELVELTNKSIEHSSPGLVDEHCKEPAHQESEDPQRSQELDHEAEESVQDPKDLDQHLEEPESEEQTLAPGETGCQNEKESPKESVYEAVLVEDEFAPNEDVEDNEQNCEASPFLNPELVENMEGTESAKEGEIDDDKQDYSSGEKLLSPNQNEGVTENSSKKASLVPTSGKKCVTKSGRKVVTPSQSLPSLKITSNKVKVKDTSLPETPSVEEIKEKKEKFDNENPPEYRPGAALWARVGAAPYWPCAVTHDPNFDEAEKMLFTRIMTRGQSFNREYHVQFFGRIVQRAWVSLPNILPFLGKEEFMNRTAEVKKGLQGKKPMTKVKVLKAYVSSGRTKISWEEAIQEASKTFDQTLEERLMHMKYLSEAAFERKRAPDDTSGQETKKRKREISVSGENTPEQSHSQSEPELSIPPSSKQPKFDIADQLIQAIPESVLDRYRRKLKTGFKLYHLANLEKVKSEMGDNVEIKVVDKILNKGWTLLPAMERRFYQDQAAKLFEDEETESTLEDSEYIILDSEDEAFNDNASVASSSKSARSVKSTSSRGQPTETKKTTESVSEIIGQFKNTSCCLICEDVSVTPGDLIKCKGVCQGAFHINCLDADVELSSLDDWKCQECLSGVHACMICKSRDSNIKKCNQRDCGKFFHPDCLTDSGLWPQSIIFEKQMTCPAHVCHTCSSDNPKEPFMRYNTKLLRCIRCPTSYHSGDYCVTAGTVQITMSQIICPKHYIPPSNRKSNSVNHINVTWCFLCSKGGSLICCEKCPASFHAECLSIEAPDGVFYCGHCESGRMPLYNEVVWVKLGHYRWWPSKVLHPTEVPGNIEKLPHSDGEFPIQFCGSKEYYWINHGRCFLYEEGDAERIPGASASSGKAINASYVKGLKEASELFNEYTKAKDIREAANMSKMRYQKGIKPAIYTKIKTNRPFGDCPVYTEDIMDTQVCECNSSTDNPCGPDSECINRLLKIECQPSMCKAKEKCGNQLFQKRIYPPLQVHRTQSRGWGLFPKNDIKKGDFIIEYVGELITRDEYRKRLTTNKENNFYYMTMDNLRMIDAGPKGNIARFMNHSCDPNCETQKWKVNGDTRVGLFATKDVPAGEELTFNYQFEAIGDVKKTCLCGAKNCSGYIGEKPKDHSNGKNNGGFQGDSSNKKKKVRVTKPKKVWEDLCFRCFDDGKLLMCDHKTCPKVYHLECLGREKMPREKWYCPWHHCVQCGKPAVGHCMHCPNAYCKAHDNIIKKHESLGNICDEHETDLDDTIEYYKNIMGGVSRLVPNPNISLEDVLDPKLPGPQTTKNFPNPPVSPHLPNPLLNASTPSFGSNLSITKTSSSPSNFGSKKHPSISAIRSSDLKKYYCKCIEMDCDWQGKKNEFFNHLIESHKFSSAVCQQKVRMVLTNMMKANLSPSRDSNSSFELSKPNFGSLNAGFLQSNNSSPFDNNLKRGKERLKICPEPTCRLKMRASNLVRHIKTKHPHVDQDTTNQALYESPYIEPDNQEGLEQSQLSTSSISASSFQLNDTFESTSTPTAVVVTSSKDGSEAKPAKERMFECQYCGLVMRASNLGRHIKARHEQEAQESGIVYIPAVGSNHEGGRKQVECPACHLFCRPSNFQRHWRRRHSEMPVPNMKIRRLEGSLDDVSPVKNQQFKNGMLSNISVEPVTYENEDEPQQPSAYQLDISEDELEDEPERPTEPVDLSCGYPSCRYFGRSTTDLANHRRRLGHPKPSKKDNGDFDHDDDDIDFSQEELGNSMDDSEMITVEPEIGLGNLFSQSSSSKHKPAAFRELKFVCDTRGCEYKSRFRQNLDRHCRKLSHYSNYLIRTSKKPNHEMIRLQAADAQMVQEKDSNQEQQQEEDVYLEPLELDYDDDEMVSVEPDVLIGDYDQSAEDGMAEMEQGEEEETV